METLGERVRAIRESKGLTQAAVAEKARMERTDINRVESGRLNLGPARLARVAAALEVSALELQPAAEPDQRGWDLLDRLEELAKNDADLLENQAAQLELLKEIRDALGLQTATAHIAPIRRDSRS